MGDKRDNIFTKSCIVAACLKTLIFSMTLVHFVGGLLALVVGLWMQSMDLKDADELGLLGDLYSDLMCGAVYTVILSIWAFPNIYNTTPKIMYNYGCFLSALAVLTFGAIWKVVCYPDMYAEKALETLHLNLQNTNPPSKTLELAQWTMKCCGVSNYTDWLRLSPQRVIPLSCCVDPYRCVTANYGDVYHKGCYEIMLEYLKDNINIVVAAIIIAFLIPAGGMFLTCYLGFYMERLRFMRANKRDCSIISM